MISASGFVLGLFIRALIAGSCQHCLRVPIIGKIDTVDEDQFRRYARTGSGFSGYFPVRAKRVTGTDSFRRHSPRTRLIVGQICDPLFRHVDSINQGLQRIRMGSGIEHFFH